MHGKLEVGIDVPNFDVWRRLASDLKPDLAKIGTRTEAFADLPTLFQAYLDADVTGRTVIALD